MSNFTPADGEKARWRYCYELMEGKDAGDGVTYQEIEELLGCDRLTAQQAMSAAKRRLEQEGKRSFATRTNYGWVMLRADGMISEGDRYWNSIKSKAKRRTDVLGAAGNHRQELNPQQRRELDSKSAHAAAIADIVGRRKTPLADLIEPDRKSNPFRKIEK